MLEGMLFFHQLCRMVVFMFKRVILACTAITILVILPAFGLLVYAGLPYWFDATIAILFGLVVIYTTTRLNY